MTKKADKLEIKSRAGVSGMVKAFVDAVRESQNTGDLIASCVTAGNKFYRGKDIPDGDLQAMVDKIADARKWTGKSAPTRKSEARCVLRWYGQLNDVVAAYRKRNKGNCTWHNVVTLARGLETSNGKIASTVNALIKRGNAVAVAPNKLASKEAKKQAAIAVNRILKMTRLPSDYRAKLYAISEDINLNVAMPKRAKS